MLYSLKHEHCCVPCWTSLRTLRGHSGNLPGRKVTSCHFSLVCCRDLLLTRDTCVCAHTLPFGLLGSPINRGPNNRMFTFSDPPQPLKTFYWINLETFWVYQGLLDMLTTIVSNSHFGKRPIAREMTIFGFHVRPHVPNIEYFKVYGGIWW